MDSVIIKHVGASSTLSVAYHTSLYYLITVVLCWTPHRIFNLRHRISHLCVLVERFIFTVHSRRKYINYLIALYVGIFLIFSGLFWDCTCTVVDWIIGYSKIKQSLILRGDNGYQIVETQGWTFSGFIPNHLLWQSFSYHNEMGELHRK